MSGTATTPVLTSKTIEDWLLWLAPAITLAAGFNLTGLIPGLPGVVTAAIVGALAKFVIGLGQNPHISNYEDWIPLIVILLSSIAASLGADPRLATYGLIIGLFAKSLPMFKEGFNIEDGLLFVGSLLAFAGQAFNSTPALELGLIISVLGKAWPSIGTNGEPGTLHVSIKK